MNRIFTFCFWIAILLLATPTAMSQVSLGVFGGLNRSKLQGDEPVNGTYKALSGLNAGLYLDIGLGKHVKLSLQPMFSQEGTQVSYAVPDEDELLDSLQFRLNYLSLPLMIKISSTNKRFYAISGVEAAFLMDHSLRSGEETIALNHDVLQYNIAAHFGAGLNIPFRFGGMFIELRYTQGVVNLTDQELENSHLPRVKSSGFKVFVGYNIPLSKKSKSKDHE